MEERTADTLLQAADYHRAIAGLKNGDVMKPVLVWK